MAADYNLKRALIKCILNITSQSFYTPDESRSYYGMVQFIRLSIRPSIH